MSYAGTGRSIRDEQQCVPAAGSHGRRAIRPVSLPGRFLDVSPALQMASERQRAILRFSIPTPRAEVLMGTPPRPCALCNALGHPSSDEEGRFLPSATAEETEAREKQKGGAVFVEAGPLQTQEEPRLS